MNLAKKTNQRVIILLMSFVVFIATQSGSEAQSIAPNYMIQAFGPQPEIPDSSSSPALKEAIRTSFLESVAPVGSVSQFIWGSEQERALALIAASGDPRLAWLISDLMRFAWQSEVNEQLSQAAAMLLGKTWLPGDPWNQITDHLIAWNIPAPSEYLKIKRGIYTTLMHGWDKLFVEGDIDWRYVTWGGVPIDARPYNNTDIPCSCIPAIDNPRVSGVEEATWLNDSDIVFGIEVNGEHRAYPRQIMEVREMVNDTLGGRELGIPYCTLCGAAQAYYTDQMPSGVKRPVLRTSGLLSRSNKVMFDIETYSIFDTFRGTALTGPLAKKGIVLDQVSVVTTSWGDWRKSHPNTTVLVEELALGRNFDFRNGRDAEGPIFPIGDIDPRLPIQEDVIGVVSESGTAVAFPRGVALLALKAGQSVSFENINLLLDAGGIRAVDKHGADLGSHQAYWFAWSQFYPGTVIWVSD